MGLGDLMVCVCVCVYMGTFYCRFSTVVWKGYERYVSYTKCPTVCANRLMLTALGKAQGSLEASLVQEEREAAVCT